MDEPIAIIGLDARLPGDGETAEQFFESLVHGRSARTEIPPDRFNIGAFWHPNPKQSGSTAARSGHFLRGSIAAFDAPFFSITPTEARGMDPQQRGMLECTYRALENAGIPLQTATGTQTGVYIGCFTSDYNDITVKDLDVPSEYAATGTVACMLSNRLSWFFDFQGPSVTVDTACSSSLVAIHEACQSLKLREVTMAVAGGCNLMLTPEMTLKLDAAGVLGPDGKSRSFDHKGNGYARGEGFGAIILKRLSDAVREGDTIRAIIRNSATNQDGRSPGIAQPTKAGQARLIDHVYTRAGLDPALTRFFEAHGTGTVVGDPIEASAISSIFSQHRSKDEPLYVGALKSNVGHLEGAAGVAAVIKGVLALERGIIPPNIWFEKLNPGIDSTWNLKFPTEVTPWPQRGLRRMSINSFGIGGSNAHVVMDDAGHFLQERCLVGNHRTILEPAHRTSLANGVNGHHSPQPNGTHTKSVLEQTAPSCDTKEDHDKKHPLLYMWSTHDQNGVERIKKPYRDYICKKFSDATADRDHAAILSDMAYTLSERRSHLPWRVFAVAHSRDSLVDALVRLPKPRRAKSQAALGFIFTGQGAQWPKMGLELMYYPVFRHCMLLAEQYFNSLGCLWSLTNELSKGKDDSQLDNPEICQPLCTALQVSLIELLSSWGVCPDAVVGHSSGEIAAAYSTGAISREAAWKIAYFRGKVSTQICSSSTHPDTTMAAVGTSLEKAQGYIDQVLTWNAANEGSLEIACMNSWDSYTVSGSSTEIETLVQVLSDDGIFARKLQVGVAYHSRYMQPVSDAYFALLGDLPAGEGRISPLTYYSSTRGESIPLEILRDPAYWVENLVSPVLFRQAATAMLSGTGTHPPLSDLLEIGPHSALKAPLQNLIKSCRQVSPPDYHSMMKRNLSGIDTALDAAGNLYCSGYVINVDNINSTGIDNHQKGSLLTDLPSYKFNHAEEYWKESRISRNYRLRPIGHHELLGVPVSDWNKDNAIWRNYISLSKSPWLRDHRVSGEVLFPAAAMVVMAIEATAQLADRTKQIKAFRLQDVSFHHALNVPDGAEGVESHFHLRPNRNSAVYSTSEWNEFRFMTWKEDTWVEHCRGFIQAECKAGDLVTTTGDDDLALQFHFERIRTVAQQKCVKHISTDRAYEQLEKSGLAFGRTFRTANDILVGPEQKIVNKIDSLTSEIRNMMPSGVAQPYFVMHPSTLDGVIHSCLIPLVTAESHAPSMRMPFSVREIWMAAENMDSTYLVTAQSEWRGWSENVAEVSVSSSVTGYPAAFASGLVFKSIPGPSDQLPGHQRHAAFNITWKPDPDLLGSSELLQAFQATPPEQRDDTAWFEDCEALCLLYAHRMSSLPQTDASEKTPRHHRKYAEWLRQLSRHSSALEETNPPLSQLESRVITTGSPEGRLIVAIGRALPDILGGSLDPLTVLFKDGIADDVYGLGLGAKQCYPQLCHYVDSLAHKNPNLSVLEIGGGTGGATRVVLQTLAKYGNRFRQYDFTDISPSFFESAKREFNGHLGQMNFRTLDITKDPEDQGFEAGRYDLVIAANVIHATKHIDVALSNTRKLLRPGGKLLLFEVTNLEILLVNFCFGVFPGWWLSEDKDRVWGPLMSPASWDTHLRKSGFNGLDCHLDDRPGSRAQMSSVLSATVPLEARHGGQATGLHVICDKGSTSQESIIHEVSSKFECEAFSIVESTAESLNDTTCLMMAELDAPLLPAMEPETFEAVRCMITHCKVIIWLTRNTPQGELVQGLARVARLEHPALRFVTILIDPEVSNNEVAQKTTTILRMLNHTEDNSFTIARGVIQIPRLVEANYLTEHINARKGISSPIATRLGDESHRALKLRVGTQQYVDTDYFEDDALFNANLEQHEIEFEVRRTNLHYHDTAIFTGRLQGSSLGSVGCGLVTRTGPGSKYNPGERVFGFTPSGSLKTRARSSDTLVARMPEQMTWDEGASFPWAFTTAYAVVCGSEKASANHSVLIHPGVGPESVAAILLAQLQGAEVFATARSRADREYLRKTCNLQQNQVLSPDGMAIKFATSTGLIGQGIDLFLSFGTGDLVRDASNFVSRFGRIIHVDQDRSSAPDTTRLPSNVRYETFSLSDWARDDPEGVGEVFQRAVALASNLTAWPCPRRTYGYSQISDAFRAIQTDYQIATVLQPEPEEVVAVSPRPAPACRFEADASYVVSGGLGGLGRSLARWLVSRGAQHLILLSRHGADESSKGFISDLEASCQTVAAPACDISRLESLQAVIDRCMAYMPKVKGCIQASMVLQDNRIEHMTCAQWHQALGPKVDGSLNLVSVLGPHIDFMIFLSSNVGITGNSEQANYAAASTFQDALARQLAAQGMNAVSIDLPVIQDVGFVAEKPELYRYMLSRGWTFIDESELHAVLDYQCRTMIPVGDRAQVIPRLWHPKQTVDEGFDPLPWAEDPFFSSLRTEGIQATGIAAETSVDHARLLSRATSLDAAEKIVLEALLLKLSRLLSVGVDDLDAGKPLHAFGIDSLVAVEIRSWLKKSLSADVSILDVTNQSSIDVLAKTAAAKSTLIGEEQKQSPD